jgi:DNA invertase Pin-like site-specific DNA recombinase
MPKQLVGVNERGLRVGEDHQRAKLSNHEIELIRQLREQGMTCRAIAEKFEISKAMVSYICSHKKRAQTAVRWR